MAKKLNKFIICLLAGVIVLGLSASTVSAKTLRERDQEARAKYQAAKAQYLKEVNWWKKTRQQFLNARAKYRKFKNAENKAAYEEQARAFLERTVEVLIKKLESLKNWVSNKPSLSESAREAIVAEIEEDIEWLKSKKSEIATASPNEIKKKAREIREYWRKHRIFVKKIIGEIWAARLDWVIERFETVSSKVANKIDELKVAGKDTSHIEAWLADFNQKIEIAKEKRDKAREKYQAISSLADANQLFKQAHQFIKEANQYLKEAHRKLVDIVKEMKKVATSAEPTE
ncbi:hypothetical protein J7K44_03215 [bacterium]|nr:hypothetical protein [bacterium]